MRTVSNHVWHVGHLVKTHPNPFLSDTMILMGRREKVVYEVLGGGYYRFRCPSFEPLFTCGPVWDSLLETALKQIHLEASQARPQVGVSVQGEGTLIYKLGVKLHRSGEISRLLSEGIDAVAKQVSERTGVDRRVFREILHQAPMRKALCDLFTLSKVAPPTSKNFQT